MRDEARRVGIAVTLFLVLTAGTVLAAGVTEVATLKAGPLPERFQLAEPRVGDSGTFMWARVQVERDGSVRVLNEHEIFGFEWLPPARVSDADGVRRDSLMLHQWGWQPRVYTKDPATVPRDGWERYAEPVYAIELATDVIRSYAYLSEATANPERQDPDESRSLQRMFARAEDRFFPACGPFPAFGGRDVPLDREIDLFRACQGMSNVLSVDAHAPVQAVGTQTLGDRETVLFSAKDGALHVWYDERIPVPIRVAAAACDAPRLLAFAVCEQGQYDVMRLTSFRRGITPLPAPEDAAPPTGTAPAWEERALSAGLPDETGIDHPFPASAAVTLAQRDPNGAAFKDAFDGGYLTFLRYHESGMDQTTVRVWALSAYDGTHSASVVVEQRIEPATPPGATGPLPGLPPTPQSQGSSTTVTVRSSESPSGGPWPSPDEAPQTAPTVASMWARWRAFASESHASAPPNTWGGRILCLPAEGDDCSVFIERWAGVERSSLDGESSMTVRSVLTESDNDRRGHEMYLSEYWVTSGNSDAPPVQIQAAAPGEGFTLIKSAAWVAPAKGVVVGSAFLAGLASLAYLFLPTLRFGLMVLFTRNTTPPDALRHPERQRMMTIVRDQPGIAVPELARALGRGRSPTEHHLAMLRRVGLVRIAREGPRRRIFACDADPAAHARPAVLSSDLARQILEARRANPRLGVREAAKAFAVSPGTVSYHVGRLRASGLLADGE